MALKNAMTTTPKATNGCCKYISKRDIKALSIQKQLIALRITVSMQMK